MKVAAKSTDGLVQRDRLVIVLAVISGVTDAIGFLHLGGAFASVMTGNMVLLGVSIATGDATLTIRTVAAVLAFIAGCGIGARVAGQAADGDPPWPREVSRALALELALFTLSATIWISRHGELRGAAATGLLSLAAAALGVQSAAIQRFGVRALSTTYFTGTLTTTVVELAQTGGVTGSVRNLKLLAGLIGGAIGGALLASHTTAAAPLIQVVTLIAVLLLAPRAEGSTRAAPASIATGHPDRQRPPRPGAKPEQAVNPGLDARTTGTPQA